MKYLAAITICALLATPAFGLAEPDTWILAIAPPEEYDRPYEGSVQVRTFDSEVDLRAACGINARFGCAFRVNPRQCWVFLLRSDLIAAYHPDLPDIVWRHEVNGHCAGWPGSHPGARVWPLPRVGPPLQIAP